MISKCAEMPALRAGWPEEYTGLYGEEEMDRAKIIDLSATEIVEQEREEHRLRAVGAKDAITVTWGDNWTLENVPVGKFADRALEFINSEPADKVTKWSDANREPLREFWARSPADALEVKKALEAKIGSRPSTKAA